jgi:hypothetical protein
MNWEVLTLTSIAQLVGAVAVVYSVVYLAVQVRQNTESIRAGTELETTSLWTSFHSRVAHSPDLASLWDKGLLDHRRLDPDEKRRFVWFVAEYLTLAEGLFVQHERGYLSATSWEQHERTVTGLLRNDLIARWWNDGVTPFSERFRTHVERAMERLADKSWSYTPLAEL